MVEAPTGSDHYDLNNVLPSSNSFTSEFGRDASNRSPETIVHKDNHCKMGQQYSENQYFNVPSSPSSSTSSCSSRAKKHICEYEGCRKAFTRPSLLTQHQTTVHQGLREFTCPTCEKAFGKKTHLERHLLVHSENKPFTCATCSKSFVTRQQWRRHEVTHTKSFACQYEGCDAQYYKHPQLRAHVLAVHLDKLTCQFCQKRFQRPYRLRNHIAKHHNPDIVSPYQCTYLGCTRSFAIWSLLQAHVKKDHPRLKCPVCNKPCVGDNGLQMHMIVHDETLVVKNWRCFLCPHDAFAKKSDLIEHYETHHVGFMPNSLQDNDDVVAHLPQGESVVETKSKEATDLDTIKSTLEIERYLREGNSALQLLSNSIRRRRKCSYKNCYRTFKTEEKYNRHIHNHKVHELKLQILEDKKSLKQDP